MTAEALQATNEMFALGDRLGNLTDVLKFLHSGMIGDAFKAMHDIAIKDWAALGVDGPQLLVDMNLADTAELAGKIIKQIPQMVAMMEELKQIINIFTPTPLPSAVTDGPIRMMAGPGSVTFAVDDLDREPGVFGLRLKLARELAQEQNIGPLQAFAKLRRVSSDNILRALHKAAVSKGYTGVGPDENGAFDGSWLKAIWAWIQAHPEVITALLSLLMVFL